MLIFSQRRSSKRHQLERNPHSAGFALYATRYFDTGAASNLTAFGFTGACCRPPKGHMNGSFRPTPQQPSPEDYLEWKSREADEPHDGALAASCKPWRCGRIA